MVVPCTYEFYCSTIAIFVLCVYLPLATGVCCQSLAGELGYVQTIRLCLVIRTVRFSPPSSSPRHSLHRELLKAIQLFLQKVEGMIATGMRQTQHKLSYIYSIFELLSPANAGAESKRVQVSGQSNFTRTGQQVHSITCSIILSFTLCELNAGSQQSISDAAASATRGAASDAVACGQSRSGLTVLASVAGHHVCPILRWLCCEGESR